MKRLLIAMLFASTMVLQAGPKPAVKKAPVAAKKTQAQPEKAKSGRQPDGSVIITAEDLHRTGEATLAGALRHFPYLFVRGY